MRLLDRTVSVRPPSVTPDALEEAVRNALDDSDTPVRFAVTRSLDGQYECEIGVLSGEDTIRFPSMFGFRRRGFELQSAFNIAFVVPTGIGADIGGHAGDSTPAAMIMAQVADTVVTHPNVVNASDINELPANGMYVEGSVLSRLLMGTVGLRHARSNRVLVALDSTYSARFAAYTVNAVNAARATYGLNCVGIVRIEPRLRLVGGYTPTGRASGSVDGVDGLLHMLDSRRDEYDAVAIASVVEVPKHYHFDYFTGGGEIINPWGGVEALLTHTVSTVIGAPTAHAPMMESDDIAGVDPGVVDSRMAAEVISLTFLQCVLKGLRNAPRIVTETAQFDHPDVMTAEDISCLVIPVGCIGLPTLAALHQGIPVIEVRENRNLMRNDLSRLPWAKGQYRVAENYWEAAGMVAAMRAGIDPDSARRPLRTMQAGDWC